MPDFATPLEKELSALLPSPPPERIASAIAVRLASRRTGPLPAVYLFLPWAAAASFFLLSGLTAVLAMHYQPALQTVHAADTRLRPTSVTRQIQDTLDEGVVLDREGAPFRRVRTTSVEVVSYSAPGSQRMLHYSTPREDVLLLPIAAY